MIGEIKHYGIFRVDLLRVALNLPHEEIARYCMETVDKSETYTTYHDTDLNNKFKEGFPGREQFEASLCKAADEFVERTLRLSFEKGGGHRLHYWVSVYKEGDYHDSHIHPHSLISGTYYPQTSEDSTAITFEAPYTNFLMHDTLSKQFVLFDYRPQTGDCLLWPAWLSHRVQRQGKTGKPRIAISFNFDYRFERELPDQENASGQLKA